MINKFATLRSYSVLRVYLFFINVHIYALIQYYATIRYFRVSLDFTNFFFISVTLGGKNSVDPQTEQDPDYLILIVACLGAFVLVFLILIVVCVCKRNSSKPTHSHNQSVEAPEIREKMLDQQIQVRMGPNQAPQPPQPHSPQFQHYHHKDYYTQNWINHPKMGLPLPPTPFEAAAGNGNHTRYHHESADITQPRGTSYRR